MIYTGLLSLLLAEYAANQKCSAVLLCSADSIYPQKTAKDTKKTANEMVIHFYLHFFLTTEVL